MTLRLLLALVMACATGPIHATGDAVKTPNVAGTFYPADPKVLSKTVEELLAQAGTPAETAATDSIEIAVAPHAGYSYSGIIAAHTFKALSQKQYSTIIILAPSHFYPFEGAVTWPRGALQTPLGALAVDEPMAQALLQTDVVKDNPEPFNKEHALEVELPFIQKTFGQVKIVPLLLGQPNFQHAEALAVALHRVIGSRHDVLVLISTDMSHYRSHGEAKAMDAGTLKAIAEGDIQGFWQGNLSGTMEMCGFVPMAVGLMLSKLRGLSPATVLSYANSGDTTGDKTSVVGYGAMVFFGSSPAVSTTGGLSNGQKTYLLSLARHTIEQFVGSGQTNEVKTDDPRLKQVQGAFVTITKKGELRGCIGSVIGEKPLAETVRDRAISAASQDPRFPPVTKEELGDIEVEVSVLSPLQRVQSSDDIVLGRDGVILSQGNEHQGVFLPQVATETGWSKEEFLAELCAQKAGLGQHCWKDPKTVFYTFTADVFGGPAHAQ